MQTALPLTNSASPSVKLAKPFMKWAGGKGQLLEKLTRFFPPGIQTGEIKKYAEPFIGGGALFFFIAQTFPNIKSFFLSDINVELVLVYQTIQKDVENLIKLLAQIETDYHRLDGEQQKEFFYKKRETFNQQLTHFDFAKFHQGWLKRAATTIFLNRTCFNGLFRVNANGEFNVPFGDYKNPKICDPENLRITATLLQKAVIVCSDFTQSKRFVDEHTFVYFDPPYRPLNKTANFTSYSKFDFGEEEQKRLSTYFSFLSNKGAKLMLSNSDPKNENPDDCFFEELYAGFTIRQIDAARMINCDGKKRGKIQELVITNYFVPPLFVTSKEITKMKTGGSGGKNTSTGLDFERRVDFQTLLMEIPGYLLKKIPGEAGLSIIYGEERVARCFRKTEFYNFLAEKRINWKAILSKRLLPDDALLVIVRETLFIIEVKYQQVNGSVDEKLQTCDFKRKQYLKLVASLGYKVEYVYVLNDWFKKPQYKDVLDYIHSVNCHYKFNRLPLAWLGLPDPKAGSEE